MTKEEKRLIASLRLISQRKPEVLIKFMYLYGGYKLLAKQMKE